MTDIPRYYISAAMLLSLLFPFGSLLETEPIWAQDRGEDEDEDEDEQVKDDIEEEMEDVTLTLPSNATTTRNIDANGTTCSSTSNPCVGTDGDDEMTGDDGMNYILAEKGNDLINGGGGKDTVHGNDGVDTINGEDDDDGIYGEWGDDKIDGGEGDDSLNGNLGNDIVTGGIGNDALSGEDGNDNLKGGKGADHIIGGNGNDLIWHNADGQPGDPDGSKDTIDCGEGEDQVWINQQEGDVANSCEKVNAQSIPGGTPSGDKDNDFVPDTSDNCPDVSNNSQMDSDNDGLGDPCDSDLDTDRDGVTDLHDNCKTISNPDQKDTDNNGLGDICDTQSNTQNDTQRNQTSTTQNTTTTQDFAENTVVCSAASNPCIGTDVSDFMLGDDGANQIEGRKGDDKIGGGGAIDSILGNEGMDYIQGNDGDDTLNGGAERDTIFGGNGKDKIDGGDGPDSLLGEADNDNMQGGPGQDRIVGGPGDDGIQGGADSDMILGNSGADIIIGLDGDDFLYASETQSSASDGSRDLIYCGAGYDQVWLNIVTDNDDAAPDCEKVYENNESPVIKPTINCNSVPCFGTDESENIVGLSGANTIVALAGGDKITGNQQDDFIDGGTGEDSIVGSGGKDVLMGGHASDKIDGGDGDDTIYASTSMGDTGNARSIFISDTYKDTIDCGAGNDILWTNLNDFDEIKNCEIIHPPRTSSQYKVTVTFDSITVHDNREDYRGLGEYDLVAYVQGMKVGLSDATVNCVYNSDLPTCGLFAVDDGQTINFKQGVEYTVLLPKTEPTIPIAVYTMGSEVDGCGRTSFANNHQYTLNIFDDQNKDWYHAIGDMQYADFLYKCNDAVDNNRLGTIMEFYDPASDAGTYAIKSSNGDFTLRYTISITTVTPTP